MSLGGNGGMMRRASCWGDESRNLDGKSKAWTPEAAVVRVSRDVHLARRKKGKY
jgi:hypothetical protein